MIALEGVDPGSWIKSIASVDPVVVVAVVPWIVVLLIWRGSEKLGIIGIGTTIKTDLNYVVSLLEHVIGKPPTREHERAAPAPVVPPAPKS